MSITNGTIVVERVTRPADFESKRVSVSLSFTIEEGEAADDWISRIGVLAHTKMMEMLRRPEAASVSNVRDQPKPVKVPPKAAAEPVEAPTSATPLPEQSGDPIITDDAMMKACQRTTARLHSPAQTRAVISKFVDKVGMSVISIPQGERAEFVAMLDALKHEEAE